MAYSGADKAREARESLGKALAALQEDPNIPPDVMAVAENIAQAVGALFDAEKGPGESGGKNAIRRALGSLSQTLALLQDVRSQHRGIQVATEVIATSMSTLYPLTTVPSHPPPGAAAGAQPRVSVPRAAPVPEVTGPAQELEVNLGATTESNFYVGFSGEVAEGGVFVATYDVHAIGTGIHMLVTLPGGFQFKAHGVVRFVRDPLDFSADAEPGMGIQFRGLEPQARELVLRFLRKRPPMFYDE